MFSGDRPKDFGFITEAADKNDNIRTPAAANITDEMRSIIPLTPEWTYWPDYERVKATHRSQVVHTCCRWAGAGSPAVAAAAAVIATLVGHKVPPDNHVP